MSVKKTIDDAMGVVYRGLDKVAKENHDSLAAFADKLEKIRKPSRFAWLISLRNWLTFFLLCAILLILLASCKPAQTSRNLEDKDSSYLLIRGRNVYFYPSDGVQQHWDSVYYLKVD